MQSKTYNNYCAIYTPEIQRLAIYHPFGIPNRVIDCFEMVLNLSATKREKFSKGGNVVKFDSCNFDTTELFELLSMSLHFVGEFYDNKYGESMFDTHIITKYYYLPYSDSSCGDERGVIDIYISPSLDYVSQAVSSAFNGDGFIDVYGKWTRRVIFANKDNDNKVGLDVSVKGQVLINCGEGYQEFTNVNGAMIYIERFWSKK